MSNNLEILRSIISPLSIVKSVLKEYNFSSNLKCVLKKAYGSNDIYEIEDNGTKYILKLYNTRQCWEYCKDHYLFEANLQKFFHENQLSVPCPIYNKNNSLVSEINTPEYKKYYIVYTYLKGELWNNDKKDRKRAYALGKNLGYLHTIGENYKSDLEYTRIINFNFLLQEPYKRIKALAHNNPHESKILDRINDIVPKLENLINSNNLNRLKWGIIHGDVHQNNHFYIKENKEISFFDFELCGYGYQVYDLAVFKWGISLGNRKTYIKYIMQSFLEGYLSINNLPNTNLEWIDHFVKIRHIFITGSSVILYPEASEYLFNNWVFSMLFSPIFKI